MTSTRSDQHIWINLRIPENEFNSKTYVLENQILFSFIECSTLWNVNTISIGDLQMEYLIKKSRVTLMAF